MYKIDKKWLKRREEQREEPPVRYLGIDELCDPGEHIENNVHFE